jgi:hypothetical protein
MPSPAGQPYDNLTKQAFDGVGWPALIAAAQTKECYEYLKPLNERTKALDEAKNPDAARAARTLADIMGYGFHPYEVERPFHPMMTLGNQRSPMPEDLPDTLLPVLVQLVNEAADPEFKARLGDVCTLRLPKKDPQLIEATAAAYLDSAQNLSQAGRWVHAVPRFRRALQLARKPSPALGQKVTDAFTHFLKNQAPTAPLLEVVQMLELHHERVGNDAAILSPEAAKYAQKAQDQKAWHLRRRLLELAAACLQALGNEHAAKAALDAAAETYVNLADESLARPEPVYLVAADHLLKAITAHREIDKQSKRAAELELLRAKYQKEGIQQTRWVNLAEEAGNEPLKAALEEAQRGLESAALAAAKTAQGLPLEEAFRLLLLCHPPPNKANLEETVVQELKENVWLALVPMTVYDEEGRPFAKAGSYLHENPKGQRLVVEQRMLEWFKTHHVPQTVAIFEAVREQIIAEHNITPDSFQPVISHSPFIPQGRHYLFFRGLHAGLTGDFLLAGHLLAPQLEDAIRAHLQASGAIPTVTEKTETERTADLNYLFNHKRPQIEAVFGVDETFELEALLIRRWGCHLRNNIAHGKLWPQHFFEPPMRYLWWLTMRFCMFGPSPLPKPWEKRDSQPTAGATGQHPSQQKNPNSP